MLGRRPGRISPLGDDLTSLSPAFEITSSRSCLQSRATKKVCTTYKNWVLSKSYLSLIGLNFGLSQPSGLTRTRPLAGRSQLQALSSGTPNPELLWVG